VTGPARAFWIAVLCFIWGSTWVAIKVGLHTLPPFLSAAARFGLSAVVLALLGLVQRVPFPRTWRTHLALAGLGLATFTVSYGVVYWGEQYISSGLTAVLFSTHPFFVMLLAHVAIANEPITRAKVIGVALGLLGVVLIFRSDLELGHPLALTAALVTLGSPVAAATTNVAIKRWGAHLHPYTLTTLPMAYGTFVLGAISWMTERHLPVAWTPLAIASVVYLALFGSVVAFVIYYTLLKQVSVSALALVSYVFPVVAVLLGYLILGERLTGSALAGAATILVGIAVAVRGSRS
jgi:drug/metabolite transporter (DMT)-like permease